MTATDRWYPRIVLAASVVLCCVSCPARAERGSVDARQALDVLCPGRANLAPAFDRAANRHGVPATLLVAMSRNEAGCRPDAVSKSGLDVGLMQIRVGTLAARGRTVEQLKRPEVNVSLAARHLAACLALCGDFGAALGIYSGRRTCSQGRASGYAMRVLGFWAEVKGERRS